MPTSNNHILVFDSGVGGLSIVEHIQQQLPHASICYLADNALHPYGLLKEQMLIDRVVELVAHTVKQQQPDIVVIACNSASTLVLPALRAALNIPVVGVVPAVKPAAIQSTTKVIGLLATPGTIARDYTDVLIKDFALDCTVISLGSNKLVQLVERKLSGEHIDLNDYLQVLEPFKQHPHWPKADTVVLACTHFPLVKQELALAAPHIKHWIDSGDAIARRVVQLKQQQNFQPQTDITTVREHKNVALFTDINKIAEPLHHTLNNYGFKQISHVYLPNN